MTEKINDELLTAYLDSELSEEEAKKAEKALASNNSDLKMLEINKTDIKTSLDAILPIAPQMPELQQMRIAQKATRGFSSIALAASLALGMISGAWLFNGTEFRLYNSEPSLEWKTAIANYQMLYVPETLANSSENKDQAIRKLKSLSNDLGRELVGANSVNNLEFYRAQMLGLEGNPLVQIVYMAENGTPIAICVTKVNETNYEPKSELIQGLASSHWVDDKYGFLVIGGKDLNFVENIASNLAKQL